jgi:PadR family transcriptional regulator
MRADTLRGHLDALVLATLRAGPLHGYAVIDALRGRSDGAFDLAEGTVYPVLHRLEVEGLLASAWTTEAGRRRRVYRLTRAGTAALGKRREDWRAFSRAVDAVLA